MLPDDGDTEFYIANDNLCHYYGFDLQIYNSDVVVTKR